MQTCLEKKGIEERHTQTARSDYNKNDEYSATHKDALSDGDAQGKGTGHGGHTHFLPDCNKPTNAINYSNFDTKNGGGKYDIEGRNGIGGRKRMMAFCMYGPENPYSAEMVTTDENIADGQYQIK
jgi:hypothetical protein